VTITEYLDECARLEREGRELLASLDESTRLDAAKGALNLLKDERLAALQAALRTLDAADRRAAGAAFNALKGALAAAVEDFERRRASDGDTAGDVDRTMPARRQWVGGRHPVTVVMDEITQIFRELGFSIAVGPEAETEWYNFRALNFPADHPAMDMHDTLYLGDDVLLRTHTSPVQIRTLQRHAPPVRVLVPGNVYRRDFFDPSHAPMFAQVEGLAVDEGIGFVDLKATLTRFATLFFGATKTRFRPSYFPFTEPSAEMDVQCRLCGGAGCSGCKGTGWMEILGSGMVHPAVLDAAGVDGERFTGWAFGMGPARIAMLRYGVPDIRLLYDSDVRFLAQLAG
jgi:phenylalanyl-tRNA synthetase alpha chain